MTISAYQRIILPRPGKPFVFVRTPGASYASVGIVYTASYGPDVFDGGDVYIAHNGGTAGTFDRISAWLYAIWHYAARMQVDPQARSLHLGQDVPQIWARVQRRRQTGSRSLRMSCRRGSADQPPERVRGRDHRGRP
jgi:hypothetical protein